MANRMNMLKLLQEVQGFASFTRRRPAPRHTGALLLQLRSINFRRANAPRRRILRINVQNPPDIPRPVQITFIQPSNAEKPPDGLI
jgi:hypothetical protein